LGSYYFTIIYRLGIHNIKADILSRRIDYLPKGQSDNQSSPAPLLKPDQLVIAASKVTLLSQLRTDLTLYQLQKAYPKDPKVSRILSLFHQGSLLEHYSLEEGILYFKEKVYIPDITLLKLSLLHQYHDSLAAGHFSINKTLELVSRDYFFPRITYFIKEYINSYNTC